jgi:hypothetical protein
MIEDPASRGFLGEDFVHHYVYWAATAGAIFVVAVGWFLRRRKLAAGEDMVVEHAVEAVPPRHGQG